MFSFHWSHKQPPDVPSQRGRFWFHTLATAHHTTMWHVGYHSVTVHSWTCSSSQLPVELIRIPVWLNCLNQPILLVLAKREVLAQHSHSLQAQRRDLRVSAILLFELHADYFWASIMHIQVWIGLSDVDASMRGCLNSNTSTYTTCRFWVLTQLGWRLSSLRTSYVSLILHNSTSQLNQETASTFTKSRNVCSTLSHDWRLRLHHYGRCLLKCAPHEGYHKQNMPAHHSGTKTVYKKSMEAVSDVACVWTMQVATEGLSHWRTSHAFCRGVCAVQRPR